MSGSLLDWLMSSQSELMTKSEFGQLIHSDYEDERDRAIEALALAGDYDNLPDD